MANPTNTLRPIPAKQGRNPGPVNTKPKAVNVVKVKPGYKPENQLVKPGGK